MFKKICKYLFGINVSKTKTLKNCKIQGRRGLIKILKEGEFKAKENFKKFLKIKNLFVDFVFFKIIVKFYKFLQNLKAF